MGYPGCYGSCCGSGCGVDLTNVNEVTENDVRLRKGRMRTEGLGGTTQATMYLPIWSGSMPALPTSGKRWVGIRNSMGLAYDWATEEFEVVTIGADLSITSVVASVSAPTGATSAGDTGIPTAMLYWLDEETCEAAWYYYTGSPTWIRDYIVVDHAAAAPSSGSPRAVAATDAGPDSPLDGPSIVCTGFTGCYGCGRVQPANRWVIFANWAPGITNAGVLPVSCDDKCTQFWNAEWNLNAAPCGGITERVASGCVDGWMTLDLQTDPSKISLVAHSVVVVNGVGGPLTLTGDVTYELARGSYLCNRANTLTKVSETGFLGCENFPNEVTINPFF